MLIAGIALVFVPPLLLVWGLYTQTRAAWRTRVFQSIEPRERPSGGDLAGDREPRVGPLPAGASSAEMPVPVADQVA